jgi:hypothetical protein
LRKKGTVTSFPNFGCEIGERGDCPRIAELGKESPVCVVFLPTSG